MRFKPFCCHTLTSLPIRLSLSLQRRYASQSSLSRLSVDYSNQNQFASSVTAYFLVFHDALFSHQNSNLVLLVDLRLDVRRYHLPKRLVSLIHAHQSLLDLHHEYGLTTHQTSNNKIDFHRKYLKHALFVVQIHRRLCRHDLVD